MDEKKRLSLTEVLADIATGLSDRELVEKYELSPDQLAKVFAKLVEQGRLTQDQVDARKEQSDDILLLSGEFSSRGGPASSSQDRARGANQPIPSAPPGSGGSLPPPPENWQNRAALGIIGGIILGGLSGAAPALGKPLGVPDLMTGLAALLLIGGWIAQLWGCYYLVKGKGYHGAFSILGALCCLGLVILLVLPNKYGGTTMSGGMIALIAILVAAVAVAVTGIILAIAIPYYISYKRTTCDRAASADVGKLAAAVERLHNELKDQNLKFDDGAIGRAAENNMLRYLVGPYYGFAGTTKKCSVVIRMNRQQGRWLVEGLSLKGSHPTGQTSRYLYRAPVAGGGDLPATITKDVVDAGNGKSLDWNAYPYAPPGQPELCYTESVIQAEESVAQRTFSLKVPRGIPCPEVRGK